jgi:hypothetical protein
MTIHKRTAKRRLRNISEDVHSVADEGTAGIEKPCQEGMVIHHKTGLPCKAAASMRIDTLGLCGQAPVHAARVSEYAK